MLVYVSLLEGNPSVSNRTVYIYRYIIHNAVTSNKGPARSPKQSSTLSTHAVRVSLVTLTGGGIHGRMLGCDDYLCPDKGEVMGLQNLILWNPMA